MSVLPFLGLLVASTPAPTAEPSAATAEPALTASAPRSAREQAEPRFTVWAGPRGGLRFGRGPVGGGGSGGLGLGVRTIRGLWLAVEVAEGFYSGPGETLGQIRIGLRYEFWTKPVRPLIWLGADHAHQQTWANTTDEPFLTMVGASDTIEHRTGLGAGVGVRIPIARSANNLMKYFSILPRVDFTYFIDQKPAPVVLGLSAMLSANF